MQPEGPPRRLQPHSDHKVTMRTFVRNALTPGVLEDTVLFHGRPWQSLGPVSRYHAWKAEEGLRQVRLSLSGPYLGVGGVWGRWGDGVISRGAWQSAVGWLVHRHRQ